MPAGIKDLEYKKFIKPESQEPIVRTSAVDGFNLSEYDEVQVTYPTSTTEVFTFKLSASTIAIITLTYTNSSKNDLQSAVKS